MFYNLNRNIDDFGNYSDSSEEVKIKAKEFFNSSKGGGSSSFATGYRRVGVVHNIEYTTTSYQVVDNIAEIEILLNAKTNFSRRTNSFLRKEEVTFRVQYVDSQCTLVSTDFFDIVLADKFSDGRGKLIFFIIFIIIPLFGLILLILLVLFLLKIFRKK